MTSRALSLLGLVGVVAGCESRTPQCNRLVDAINQEHAKMAPILVEAGGPEPTETSLESYARANDDLAAKLRGLKLKDAKLVAYRDRYHEIVQGLAAATRKTAVRLDTPREAQKAADEVKAFSPRKRALEQDINAYCRGSKD